ncbi:MAG: GntR family transcriptional regulator [Acidimicrobiia bacterium]
MDTTPLGLIADQEPPSRVDWVFSQLRRAIVNGEFAPGAPLKHNELSKVFGVSLIPIREAIRKLEMEKLVESAPNRGAWVAPITAKEVHDVYSVRILLESEALRRSMPELDQADVLSMRDTYAQMLALGRRDDDRYPDLHRKLHYTLYEKCDSSWLLHMIETLWSHTERHRRLASKIVEFATDLDSDLHGNIIDYVEAGDVAEAVKSLERDLSRISDLVASAYG